MLDHIFKEQNNFEFQINFLLMVHMYILTGINYNLSVVSFIQVVEKYW